MVAFKQVRLYVCTKSRLLFLNYILLSIFILGYKEKYVLRGNWVSIKKNVEQLQSNLDQMKYLIQIEL